MNSPNTSIRARPVRPRLKSVSANRGNTMLDCRPDLASIDQAAPERVARMSYINEENKQLQAQLKDWELKYDEQVRDVVQKQTEVERALRSKNTHLEDYATKAKDRVAELEAQLQQTRIALQAAETANVQLEKRVEIMSDLLTSVPPRSEPHAETPTRKRMHVRPRSMLPRLSTAGSWIGSFDRMSDTGTSPALSYTHMRDNTVESFEPLEPIVSRQVSAFSPRQSTAGYDSDDRPFSATSMTFSESNRHNMDTVVSRSTRPMRRMRRFGPGGNTKPLILPFASQYDSAPVSAPLMEQYEPYQSFPLERFISTDSGETASPVRSRSNTMAHDETLAALVGSSESKDSSEPEATFRRMLSLARQHSDNRTHSYISTGSDFGGLVSRNLLEELNNVKISERQKMTAELEHIDGGADRAVDSVIEVSDTGELSDAEDLDMLPSIQHEDFRAILLSSPMTRMTSTFTTPKALSESVELDVFNPALEGIMGPFNNSSPASELTPGSRTLAMHGQPASMASLRSADSLSLSTLDRVRGIFGDLISHPADVARLIIHVTQQRMHVPAPLLSVPWWLVSILWGPMARRRLLEQERVSTELSSISEIVSNTTSSMLSSTPSLAVSESLAYGTLYSSHSAQSTLRQRTGMAGPGRKRVGSKQHAGDSLIARHNPLLWAKFSLTLAYAVGTAFTAGPGSLLQGKYCPCKACKALDKTI